MKSDGSLETMSRIKTVSIQYFHRLGVIVLDLSLDDHCLGLGLNVLRHDFYFYFYEILVDSLLATRRIGEQKCSCLQFASSAHNVVSAVMETFCVFV